MDLSCLLSNTSPGPLFQPTHVSPVPLINFKFHPCHPNSLEGHTPPVSAPLWNFPPVHDFYQPHLSQYQTPSPPSTQQVGAAPPLLSLQADFSLGTLLLLPAPVPTPAALILHPLHTSANPLLMVPLKEGFVDTGGATTFASQNPLKDIQPPRFWIHESQTDVAKLGWAGKKLERDGKADALKEGVDVIIKS